MEADGVGADGSCERRTNQPAAATPMTATADAAISTGRLRVAAGGGAAADDVAPGMITVAGAAATAGRAGAVSDSSARHVGDRLRPAIGAHGEAGVDAGQQSGRKRPLARGERRQGVVEHAVDGIGRRLAGDGEMQRRGQAIDVGRRSLRGGGELLDGAIARREHRRHVLRASGDRHPRGAEIDQRRVALGVEQDVRGLDVAVQESRGMDRGQPVEEPPQDRVERRGVERTVLRDLLVQGTASHQFHDQVGRAVRLEEVVHQHDAGRAMQGGQRAPLGDEAVAAPGEVLGGAGRARHHRRAVLADGERGRQVFLDRDVASQLAVDGTVGDAEAALAEDRDDAIAADMLVRPQRDMVELRAYGIGVASRDLHAPHDASRERSARCGLAPL